jgi:hypothetical protein
MSQQTHVTLDRAQRAALRRELGLLAYPHGDLGIAVDKGERDYVVARLRQLRRMVDALDAIGWTEQPDTPDRQPVCSSRSLAAFARREAKSLLNAFNDFDPSDEDLDAYHALCALGVPEAV